MSTTARALARELLEGGAGGLKELRVHEFRDDESAHADEAIGRLCEDFSAEFDRVQTELESPYGLPLCAGEADTEMIPLNGVFRFAVWEVGDVRLFAAASHEDRGVPILLMLGTV